VDRHSGFQDALAKSKAINMEERCGARHRTDEALERSQRHPPFKSRAERSKRPIGFLFSWDQLASAKPNWPCASPNFFDDERAMVRIDMSEIWRSTPCRGGAPRYVGYEEGGQLTEQVRRHPYGSRCS
jgi:hypothetical protein